MENTREEFPIHILILMSFVTFLLILVELAPSGFLPEMAAFFNVELSRASLVFSVYALASAICSIPLTAWAVHIHRKKLLTFLLGGILILNLIIGFIDSFIIVLIARLFAGILVGMTWPMITAYGLRLCSSRYQGRAISIIMGGATIGLMVGLPFITYIGTEFNWNMSFFAISAIAGIILILSLIFIPPLGGEEKTEENSAWTILKNKNIQVILLLTILTMVGHYGIYVYITAVAKGIHYTGSIASAQLLHGIGSGAAIFVSAKFADDHLQELTVMNIFISAIAMVILLLLKGSNLLSYITFFLWGYGYGALSSLYQAACSRQVASGKAIANAMQSSFLNFSIMGGSALGGVILNNQGAMGLPVFSLICFIPAVIIALQAKKVYATNK